MLEIHWGKQQDFALIRQQRFSSSPWEDQTSFERRVLFTMTVSEASLCIWQALLLLCLRKASVNLCSSRSGVAKATLLAERGKKNGKILVSKQNISVFPINTATLVLPINILSSSWSGWIKKQAAFLPSGCSLPTPALEKEKTFTTRKTRHRQQPGTKLRWFTTAPPTCVYMTRWHNDVTQTCLWGSNSPHLIIPLIFRALGTNSPRLERVKQSIATKRCLPQTGFSCHYAVPPPPPLPNGRV